MISLHNNFLYKKWSYKDITNEQGKFIECKIIVL